MNERVETILHQEGPWADVLHQYDGRWVGDFFDEPIIPLDAVIDASHPEVNKELASGVIPIRPKVSESNILYSISPTVAAYTDEAEAMLGAGAMVMIVPVSDSKIGRIDIGGVSGLDIFKSLDELLVDMSTLKHMISKGKPAHTNLFRYKFFAKKRALLATVGYSAAAAIRDALYSANTRIPVVE